MKATTKALERRLASIEERLDRRNAPDGGSSVLGAGGVFYEVSDRIQAIAAGGLGAVRSVLNTVGLELLLRRELSILKQPKPYHDSDHVLALVFNILSGGECLSDLESRRRDEAFLDALSAQRLPHPTTSGDYLRRFEKEAIRDLERVINLASARVWRTRPEEERELATIDVDGTIVSTEGECKEGMDISYKNLWGYCPLLVSLANSQEVLSIVNRPANVVSHHDCFGPLERAIAWARNDAGFAKVRLRGDTDFALTAHFDSWTDRGVEFVFGIDAHRSFVSQASALGEDAWSPLVRPERVRGLRSRPENVKDKVVEARGYRKITTEEEHVTELPYRPRKSKKKGTYRMVVVRKTIRVTQGQLRLDDEVRFHFYVTNIPADEMSAAAVVFENNARCHQENLIEQLKNGVHATRLPSHAFYANWAYMLIGALAWNIKNWYAMVLPIERKQTEAILKMEFRRFLNELILIPAQILVRGRRLVYRLLAVNHWVPLVTKAPCRLKHLRLA